MNIKRRSLLVGTALVLPFGLAGCAGSATPTVSSVATDANLIATGLLAVDADLKSIVPPIATATLNTIAGYLTTVQADAATIASQTTSTTSTVASEFLTVVKDVVPIVAGLFPGGGTVVDIAEAALSLLPSVATVFGLTAAAPGAPPPRYTADEAREKLANAKSLLAAK